MNEAATMQRASTQREARMGLWPRAGAAAGLLSIIVSTIGFLLHGDYPMGKNGAQIVTWAAGTSRNSFGTGIYVEVLGYLAFLLFAAWLWMVGRDRGGAREWFATSGFVAAVLLVGSAAMDNGLWSALLDGAQQGTNPQTLTVLRDGAQRVFEISYLFEALFLLLTGITLLMAPRASRWIGLSAVVLGIGLFVPVFAIAVFVSLIFELWVLVVSIYLLIRPFALGALDTPA